LAGAVAGCDRLPDRRSRGADVPEATDGSALRLELTAAPERGEAPLEVSFEARLIGEVADPEDLGCPTLAWTMDSRDEGEVVIAPAEGCVAGVVPRTFSLRHTYTAARSYEASVRFIARDVPSSNSVQVVVTGATRTPAPVAALPGPTIIIATPPAATPVAPAAAETVQPAGGTAVGGVGTPELETTPLATAPGAGAAPVVVPPPAAGGATSVAGGIPTVGAIPTAAAGATSPGAVLPTAAAGATAPVAAVSTPAAGATAPAGTFPTTAAAVPTYPAGTPAIPARPTARLITITRTASAEDAIGEATPTPFGARAPSPVGGPPGVGPATFVPGAPRPVVPGVQPPLPGVQPPGREIPPVRPEVPPPASEVPPAGYDLPPPSAPGIEPPAPAPLAPPPATAERRPPARPTSPRVPGPSTPAAAARSGSRGVAARVLPGDLYYLSGAPPRLWRLPATGERPSPLTDDGRAVDDFAVSPSGAVAFVSGGSLYVFTPGAGTPSLLDPAAARPVWSRNGRQLAYAAGGVRVYDLAGRRHTALTEDGAPLAWSRDGARLLIALPDDSVAVVGTASGERMDLPLSGVAEAAWLPDRDVVAMAGQGLRLLGAGDTWTLSTWLPQEVPAGDIFVRPDEVLLAVADSGDGPTVLALDLTAPAPDVHTAGPPLPLAASEDFAWAPDGRHAAVAGPGGIDLLDPYKAIRVQLVAAAASRPAWVLAGRAP